MELWSMRATVMRCSASFLKRISDTGHRVVSLLTKELNVLTWPQKTVSVFQGLEERLRPRLGSLFSEQYPERSRGKVLATSTS